MDQEQSNGIKQVNIFFHIAKNLREFGMKTGSKKGFSRYPFPKKRFLRFRRKL